MKEDIKRLISSAELFLAQLFNGNGFMGFMALFFLCLSHGCIEFFLLENNLVKRKNS